MTSPMTISSGRYCLQPGRATERLLSQPLGLDAGKSAGRSGVVGSDIPRVL
jgi:hypothetical protein